MHPPPVVLLKALQFDWRLCCRCTRSKDTRQGWFTLCLLMCGHKLVWLAAGLLTSINSEIFALISFLFTHTRARTHTRVHGLRCGSSSSYCSASWCRRLFWWIFSVLTVKQTLCVLLLQHIKAGVLCSNYTQFTHFTLWHDSIISWNGDFQSDTHTLSRLNSFLCSCSGPSCFLKCVPCT